jgi:sugar phosphate isomerase/epimerase
MVKNQERMKMAPLTRRGFIVRSLKIGAVAASVDPFTRLSAQGDAQWQIGCYTRPWAQHDLRVALDAIAEAGYRYAGLMGTKTGLVISAKTTPEQAEKVKEEVRQRNLQIPSIWAGEIRVKESLQAGIEDMRRLIENAAVAGVKNLLMGGVEQPELDGPYYRAIAESCEYAASKGVGISVKPHGGTNSTGPECRRLIERVACNNFRLWYDPGNIFYYSDGALDPVQDSRTVDGLVVGVAIKDYRHPKDVELTPGTGRVNFRAVMQNLINGGFRGGPLVVETLKPGTLPEMLEEAKKARRLVESLVA